jgi:hypothetical protein
MDKVGNVPAAICAQPHKSRKFQKNWMVVDYIDGWSCTAFIPGNRDCDIAVVKLL